MVHWEWFIVDKVSFVGLFFFAIVCLYFTRMDICIHT